MSTRFRFLLCLTFLGLVAGCGPSPAVTLSPLVAASAGPFELTIVHSNDTWGYLLPCG